MAYVFPMRTSIHKIIVVLLAIVVAHAPLNVVASHCAMQAPAPQSASDQATGNQDVLLSVTDTCHQGDVEPTCGHCDSNLDCDGSHMQCSQILTSIPASVFVTKTAGHSPWPIAQNTGFLRDMLELSLRPPIVL